MEGFEYTSASVDGKPRAYTLRAAQAYRREAGECRVIFSSVVGMSEIVGAGQLLGDDDAPSVDNELAGLGRVQGLASA